MKKISMAVILLLFLCSCKGYNEFTPSDYEQAKKVCEDMGGFSTAEWEWTVVAGTSRTKRLEVMCTNGYKIVFEYDTRRR